jgi:phosphoglycerate dehydrogenase-like enzyme
MELKGKVCGVIGTGAIGAEAVRIFKVRLYGFDPA